MAFDFKIGSTVPVANVSVAGSMSLMLSDPSTGAMKMRMKANPFPTIDDWVLLPDGTLAVIRGVDLHMDLIAPDGKRRSTPSIAHEASAATAWAAGSSLPEHLPGPGSLTVTGSTFVADSAVAGAGGNAWGGGIAAIGAGTTVNVDRSSFQGDSASGYLAYGGGIANDGGGALTVSSSDFVADQATAGFGSGGAGIFNNGIGSMLVVDRSTFTAASPAGRFSAGRAAASRTRPARRPR